MDPLSATLSVVGLLDVVTRLSQSISRFKNDYKVADEDLNLARKQVLLLKEEIRALECRKSTDSSLSMSTTDTTHDKVTPPEGDPLIMDEASFTEAMSTASELLRGIEATFPMSSEPHTWRRKVRWAMKDKETFAAFKERLNSAESTLQSIVSMEQLRVTGMMHGMLVQQQKMFEKLGNAPNLDQKAINVTTLGQINSTATPALMHAQFSPVGQTYAKTGHVLSKPNKLVPRTEHFDGWGVTARLVSIPTDKGGTSHRSAVHVSLFGKMYSVQLRVHFPSYSLYGRFYSRNIIQDDSAMALACSSGDFNMAHQLLSTGMAHGSDIGVSGRPMLEYAIQSGSNRLFRLLLEHGADVDSAYGEHNMTALQSCFLRGKIDMARMLVTRGADLEHVDTDGFSVLSYMWVVDKPPDKATDFLRLCLSNDFGEVNSCDSRGWAPFHRAAAIGTSEDVEAFLRLGASLELRAEWYGWTPLFFAASHDNVETFETIVQHSGPDVYQSLDGDGWTLLHCVCYFGAARVMRLLLQRGVDVNQKSHPAPLPEDPDLSYRELTVSDIALYIGPNRVQMFTDALVETGRDVELNHADDFWWDTEGTDAAQAANIGSTSSDDRTENAIYGAEDVDDKWTTLHWASYNGSSKVRKLLLLKGADPEHIDAISRLEYPTLLPKSPFQDR